MTEIWVNRVVQILESESDSLAVLASLAGYRPVEFYRTAMFKDVEVRMSEILELELKEENLEGAIIVEDIVEEEADRIASAILSEMMESRNFSATHSLVARLRPLAPFSVSNVQKYIDVIEANNQVGWIVEDEDLVDLSRAMQASPSLAAFPSIEEKLLDAAGLRLQS